MVWNWLKNVGKAIVDTAQAIFTPQVYTARKQRENTTAIVQSNTALAERREEMQVAQLKLQYIQEKERQQFQAEQSYLSNQRVKEAQERQLTAQAEQATLSHQRAKELQERQLVFQAEQARLSQQRQDELQKFIQQVQIIINDKNLDFQRWRFEQEKELQLQILQLNQEFQRELAIYQRQTSLKVVEEQKRLENSPVWLVASDILNSNITGVMPLHIFFAPPKLQFERFANAANNNKGFPDLELTLAEGLRQFFKEYAQQKRPLDFLAGAWVSKTFHSEASIKALFGVLKSEPTLVLESEIDGDYLNFRVAYWGLNWSDFRYDPIISRLPYRNILYDAAKNRAKKWLETREKLIATGESSEEVDKIYGADNVQNLAILQKEEKFRSSGINISDLELHYRVNSKDFEELGQFFILYHCVFSGLIADEYFLIEYNLPPSLPQLLPNLINKVNDTEILKELIKSIVFYYQKMYDALTEDNERCALIPDLALDLALGLANLADKTWAKGRIIYSLQQWLKLHELEITKDFESLLTKVTSALTIDDVNYINKLNQCLQAINDNHSLSVQDACYQRGLNRSKNEEYTQAIRDFDQAIELNPQWADVYYNRGLVYMKLEQTQKAIDDYTEALKIKPNWDSAYCNRGNAYYKLGEYEQAILDYDSALRINPNYSQAQRNKDIVQGVWDEVKRQQSQQKHSLIDRRKKLENVVLISTLSGHSDYVRSVIFSSDNETLCSAADDDTIKIWDLITEKPRVSYRDQTNIYSLAFVPNSQILISCNDNKIKLWNLSIQKKEKTLIDDYNEEIYALAISDNGQILASGGNSGSILIWDLNSGKQIDTLTVNFGEEVKSIVISKDSQILAAGSTDGQIVLYNLATQEEIDTVGHNDSVNTLIITANGETLISGSDDTTIKFWNIKTGEEILTLNGHNDSVNVFAISPDGKRLVSGDSGGNIIVWYLNNGKQLKQFSAHSGGVLTLAISPDGYTLVSGGGDNLIKIWRVQD
ncbi:tetratricopeptide repeat protein [Planktothrix mougeotii]|uniref:Tetratricopeptide repeat protein n=1 Tax=Planktothrix mougeotii LEGE 06226 TaxID=1828728 RepID=A0ABR9U9L5_9CYAN|nr:tetratricopeptide repeat protein [Planktothrix mougeotii]MBE9143139.1 tetratricopeptide repeat protein [Planktothrix mougeotii LEGE 06226]